MKKKEKTRQSTASVGFKLQRRDCIDCKRTFVEEIVPIVNEVLSICNEKFCQINLRIQFVKNHFAARKYVSENKDQ